MSKDKYGHEYFGIYYKIDVSNNSDAIALDKKQMKKYYLAIDIGASSGRHILGWLEDDKICIEEIYRFENRLVEKNGHLCWDLVKLFHEVIEGLKRCKERNHIPSSIGIDTWAVDFVLLDEKQDVLGETVAYRDGRTHGVDKELHKIIGEEELYSRSGIQKQLFNTIYQLYAVKLQAPELLAKAKSFLMVPEYLNFLLTGEMKNEYTNATTTQLVHAGTKKWDLELIKQLGLPEHIFGEIHMPTATVGRLKTDIQKLIGFDSEVVLPATHDTGSAVLSVPAEGDDYIYLSSGTWSLMGIERTSPDCSEESRKQNFTNEGGYQFRYRYLKNIMGLWMLQSIRKEITHPYTFAELYELARAGSHFPSLVDVNDASFLAPKSMISAIKEYCSRTNQKRPESESEILACVYRSLAKSYADTINEVEALTHHAYPRLHIVGGGSQDSYLNQLTAEYTGKQVYTGPVEATALGNIIVQMIKDNELDNLAQARAVIKRSFEIKQVGNEEIQ